MIDEKQIKLPTEQNNALFFGKNTNGPVTRVVISDPDVDNVPLIIECNGKKITLPLPTTWSKNDTILTQVYQELDEYINYGFLKRRNAYLKDMTSKDILLRAVEELGELSQAETRDGNELEELADLFAILMHYAKKKKFTEEQIANKIMEKMAERIEIRK